MVKGELDYRIIISIRYVSLERGRIGRGTVLVMYFLAEALCEVLKLLKLVEKVDVRMNW